MDGPEKNPEYWQKVEAILAEEGANLRESSYQALQVASACKLHHDVQGSSLEEGSDVGDDMWVR